MKYILILGIFLLSSPLFAQQSSVVKMYSPDSSIMATGVLDGVAKVGLWKYYNPKTNQLISEGTFKNGLRDGQWTSFNTRGQKKVVAEYKDGKLFGPAQVYDLDGALVSQMIFQDSVLVGQFVEYYGKTGTPDYISPKQVKKEGSYDNGMKTGQWVTYHEFGEPAIVEFFKENKREGPYLEYDQEGILTVETTYVNGQLDGDFKRYFYPNRPIEVGKYSNGNKIGVWKRYYPENNRIEAEEQFDNAGRKNGDWKYYYDNGRIARVEKYKNGIAIGTWEEYFPDKSLSKRQSFDLGVPQGEYVEYHQSGKLSVSGQYTSGMKTGLWKNFFPDGELYSIGEYRNDLQTGNWKYFNKIGILIAEGKFNLGLEEGQWFYYYDGGQLKSVGSYKLGLEDGIWGLFYDNKKLTQEEFWDSGKLLNVGNYLSYDGNSTYEKGTLKDGNGTRLTYYVTGKKESEGSYKGGKAEGTWIFYHENGRKASEGSMVEGKKEGVWRYYNPSGRLEDLINYKNDEIIEDQPLNNF
ncbi:hypothetical protein JYB64_14095 [Algoriphagus aestuarii]|nr:hypothetical protein [Algoriphagus aestuarii]